MHHAGPEDLDPAVGTADRDLDPGLHEREVIATEANLPVLSEEMPGELVERPLQVGERESAVDRQDFRLGDHPLVGGVGRLVPVRAPRSDEPDGRFVPLHVADLVR